MKSPDLSPDELELVKRTMSHFLRDPDYATGEERGHSFRKLRFGQPLPLEIVLRDWCTSADEGRGSRALNGGDCFRIYKRLFEKGNEVSRRRRGRRR